MANTCGGADNTVPDDVAEAVKPHIKKTPSRQYFDQPDQNDDMTYSCLLEDLHGERCPHGKCHYNRDGKPSHIDNYKPHKPL
jgi:hypothetical protein